MSTREVACASSCGHTHQHEHVVSRATPLERVISKAVFVAIGAFACYIEMQLFIPFFFVGMLIKTIQYQQQGDAILQGTDITSCSLSALEQLSEMRLPPMVSLAIIVATFVCHVEHHPSVFVPVTAIFLGAWVLKEVLAFKARVQGRVQIS
ncbi:MAG: hypothetical protein H0X51_06775 [Parachlamydiaceae bacterium]|nr:hypothetical protein [Parachlamydiaceae bacterium]